MTKALIIKTSGETQLVNIAGTNNLEALQSIVGGWIDCVRSETHPVVGYVNDEGLMLGLPLNPIATAFFGRVLVGDAVLFGAYDEEGEYDGDNHDFPLELMDYINHHAVALRIWNDSRTEAVQSGV